jgi:DNA/RNA-binding domain of Phe-tRNA-synthetase-like protein
MASDQDAGGDISMTGQGLLQIGKIDGDVRLRLGAIGDVFADFDQDEEADCNGHGVAVDDARFFVKHCVTPRSC